MSSPESTKEMREEAEKGCVGCHPEAGLGEHTCDVHLAGQLHNQAQWEEERERLGKEVHRLRDTLQWVNDQCPGKCGAKSGRALHPPAERG